jgi:hypothetical protein
MVWLLWTNNHLVAKAATYTAHNRHKRRTSMSCARFEPAVPATEQPQTAIKPGPARRPVTLHNHRALSPPSSQLHLVTGRSPLVIRIKLLSHPVPKSEFPLWYTEGVTFISATNIWGNRHFKIGRGCMLSVVSTTTYITVESWHSCCVFWRTRFAIAGRRLEVLSCRGFLQSLRLYCGILSYAVLQVIPSTHFTIQSQLVIPTL